MSVYIHVGEDKDSCSLLILLYQYVLLGLTSIHPHHFEFCLVVKVPGQ